MDDCRAVTACRVCGGPLEQVLDLGVQCLGGQFVLPGEPDPPAFPLVLCRCDMGCGLVQLGHTVRPGLMFGDYWYRSGVTKTMRDHLHRMAIQAADMLPGPRLDGSRVLDIGCNDGTLLGFFPKTWCRIGIDPCAVADEAVKEGRASLVLHTPYPFDRTFVQSNHFDLIFTVACFYDSDDPVAFAKAVRDNLAPGGLWCVEVANFPDAVVTGAYDGICHEHLCYYSYGTLRHVLNQAGLRVGCFKHNTCNGGSMRVYAYRDDSATTAPDPGVVDSLSEHTDSLIAFAEYAKVHGLQLRRYLESCRSHCEVVHLLGASTKANTWLQHAGVTRDVVACASDRDPRKHGRRTPGTGIPIVSEEESRAAHPDVYLVGPWAFRDELIEREREFLARGGRLVFPFPSLEEVRA